MNTKYSIGNRISRASARMAEFGVTNGHLTTNLSLPSVFMNSLPKSGTNLLSRFLYLSGVFRRTFCPTVGGDVPLSQLRRLRKNVFLIAHAPYSARLDADLFESGVTNVLMVRNPVSVAVSNLHYISNKSSGHRLHNYFATALRLESERLAAVLEGVKKERFGGAYDSVPLLTHYYDFAGWVGSENCLVIRFEDLVGPNGGGTQEAQDKTVKKLLCHLGFGPDFAFPVDRLFSAESRTFRKGTIFGASQLEIEIFRAQMNPEWVEIMERLGYGEAFWNHHAPGLLGTGGSQAAT